MKKRQWATKKWDSSKNSKNESAYNSLVRMLYRRDHSPTELKNKLNQWYTPEAVEWAVQKAQDLNYIKEPEFLAQQFGEALHRKEKGIFYINNSLKKKGLPPLATDPERELSKCRDLLAKKYGDQRELTPPLRVKAFRYLTSRGFDSETINKAIKKNNFD